MRDAIAAAQSDPEQNRHFRRRWVDPPPRNRKSQGRDTLASFGKLNDSDADHSTAAMAGQRVCDLAARRVRELDRRASLLHAIGLTDAGLRTEALAAAIRDAVAG